MSPRAAWRLEGLGFERVYDYVPGKATWFADRLPKEGKLAGEPTIGDVARRDVPTCSPAAKVGMVRESVRKGGLDRCVVVNKELVVLELLRERAVASDSEAPVEDVMSSGPATFRPNEPSRRQRSEGANAGRAPS